MLTCKLFHAILGQQPYITLSNKTSPRTRILHVRASFLYIINNIPQVTQELKLFKFLSRLLQEQGYSNLSRISPNQVIGTFQQ